VSVLHPTTWWTRLDDGRIRCDVCPRACALHEGQTGLCFVRMRQGDRVVLTTYGRSSGFCVDPIEKKPRGSGPLGRPPTAGTAAGVERSAT
jgi:pyruvate formate lyase activating enzyme